MLPEICNDCVNVRRGKCILKLQDNVGLGVCFGKAIDAEAAAKIMK